MFYFFIIIIFLIILSFFSFFHSKGLRVNENIFITFLCTIFILSIILNPNIALSATLDGALLFINSVFVSLFPFLVIINIMLSYGGIDIYSTIFGNLLCKPLRLPKNCSVVLIISALCGYPIGAKYAIDLYSNKKIDFQTCDRLISIASNPSPLFVIGVVGVKLLKNKYLGYLLLISVYLSCIAMALIRSPKGDFVITKDAQNVQSKNLNSKNFGFVLKESINNAMMTSLNIGGFIILFSVIINIIKNNIMFDIVLNHSSSILHISENVSRSFILGLIEITNGSNQITLIPISNTYKILLISFLLGFSGFSIIAQVSSFTSKYNFSTKKYVANKILQGIISSIISLFLLKINLYNFNEEVFSNDYKILNVNMDLSIYLGIFIILLILPNLLKKLLNSFS